MIALELIRRETAAMISGPNRLVEAEDVTR